MQLSDLKKLDDLISNEISKESLLLKKMPIFPNFEIFNINYTTNMKLLALQIYLKDLGLLVENTPYMNTFLMFLEVLPMPIETKI
jgi:hypothetical protein